MPRHAKEPRSSNFMGMKNSPIIGAKGTWLEPEELTYPSGGMHRRCRAVCQDGKLRVIRCSISDTFFSIHASGGFITSEEDIDSGLPVFQFTANKKD